VVREIRIIVPAPRRAMRDGWTCRAECSEKPTVTRPRTTRHRVRSRWSVIVSPGRRSMTARACDSLYWNWFLNSSQQSPMKATRMTTTMGVRWMRKSLKDKSARLAMMMFGGSPISVAVPPMFEANASTIR
jgi:hypothetical protein